MLSRKTAIRASLVVLVVLLTSGIVGAAEITYQVTNDAGEVMTSGKVVTNDAALAQVEVWRIEQIGATGELGAPTNLTEVLKKVLVTFITGVLNQNPTSELKRQLKAYEDAQQAIKDLVLEAAH